MCLRVARAQIHQPGKGDAKPCVNRHLEYGARRSRELQRISQTPSGVAVKRWPSGKTGLRSQRNAPKLDKFADFGAFIRDPRLPTGGERPMPPFPPTRISDKQTHEL